MRKHNRRLVVLAAIIALVSFGCQIVFDAVTPAPTPQAPGAALTQPAHLSNTSTAVVKAVTPPPGFAGTPVPVSITPVKAVIDDLAVEYVYTENLVTALYHLYGSVLDHFVDITLTNSSSSPAKVIVQSEISGYTTQAVDTVTIPANDSVEIHQNPRLIPEAVDKLNAQKPGTLHLRVVFLDKGDEKVLLDETQQILIYSRRDFVWIPGFETQEEYELWAAWVTPNDPAVEALIRAAANYDPTGIITSGYGGKVDDEDGAVWRRLEAFWDAEADTYHLTYISTMTTFAPNSVQRMRLPAEVLDQASGNCVELAALFVSAAEAIGLEGAIIRIPGHAFAAIRTDQENASYYFVETTLIGRSDFNTAVSRGKEEWDDAQSHFDAQEEGYAWVTIPDAREKGILPIPWN